MSKPEKAKVGAAFDRAAGEYDALARFQHQVGNRLFELLSEIAPMLRPAGPHSGWRVRHGLRE